MKKIYTVVVAISTLGISYAQDVIITSEAKKIDAKIIEVSREQIKYKDWNNQSGSTFVLNTSEISTVIYQNGTVSVFNQQTNTPGKSVATSNKSENKDVEESTERKSLSEDKEIVKHGSLGGDLYALGDKRMYEEEYFLFLQQNCQQAWQSYVTGQKLWGAGWAMFGFGTSSLVIGSVLTIHSFDRNYREVQYYAGLALLTAGTLLDVGCIPCLIVGGIKRNNSHKVYNELCSEKSYAVEFGIIPTANGVGLTMNF